MNKIFGSLFNRANLSDNQDTPSMQLQSANGDNNTIQATQQTRPVVTDPPKPRGIRAYFQHLAAERERDHFEQTTIVQLRFSPDAKHRVIAQVLMNG